jgi:L-malate glycosyltransferase
MPGINRVANLARLWRGGFYRAFREIDPDIVHGHYVSDYGFLAAATGRHPLVVSAWGSDLLIDPRESRLVNSIVRWVLRRSELITYDAEVVAERAVALGAKPDRLIRVVAGVDSEFMEHVERSWAEPEHRQPVVLSHRSLGRSLFNVDVIIRAMARVLEAVPDARLRVGHDGTLRPQLENLALECGIEHAVEFIGYASDPGTLARRMCEAAVYVSIPSSDGTSVTLLEAIAAGAYPVLSDLPANREWVTEASGALVPERDVDRVAEAIIAGLKDPVRRMAAAERNRHLVRQEGLWETNMSRLESAYRDLVRVRDA